MSDNIVRKSERNILEKTFSTIWAWKWRRKKVQFTLICLKFTFFCQWMSDWDFGKVVFHQFFFVDVNHLKGKKAIQLPIEIPNEWLIQKLRSEYNEQLISDSYQDYFRRIRRTKHPISHLLFFQQLTTQKLWYLLTGRCQCCWLKL